MGVIIEISHFMSYALFLHMRDVFGLKQRSLGQDSEAVC